MKTETVKLSQVAINNENPRTIQRDKFEKLVNSILVLPKMLELRPIVVDSTMTALGGNMRTEALRAIAKMKIGDITNLLLLQADFRNKTDGEREVLIRYWEGWLKKPTVQILRADELTEDEKRQFMIKDNVSFGQWDFDKLANQWDDSLLGDWGMDVWNMNPMGFAPMGSQPAAPSTPSTTPSAPDPSEDDGEGMDNGGISENIYETKIVTPVYEPSGDKIELSEVFNPEKTDRLIERINASTVPDDVKSFLRYAAYRHTVYDYAKVADYYASATKEIQELMEESALVVIDYDKAIENGFILMSKSIAEAYGQGQSEDQMEECNEEDMSDE